MGRGKGTCLRVACFAGISKGKKCLYLGKKTLDLERFVIDDEEKRGI